VDSFDDFLAVDQGLVWLHLATLRLTIHLVFHHGLRDLVMLDLPDPFPTEFVCVWQTDVVTLRASHEHQTLNDLRIPHYSVHQQILDHVDPLICMEEFARNDFEYLVLGLNLFEFLINDDSRIGNLWLTGIFLSIFRLKNFLEVDSVRSALFEFILINFGCNLLS
jgi:hypothetical protein